jgi:hypothetical protein
MTKRVDAPDKNILALLVLGKQPGDTEKKWARAGRNYPRLVVEPRLGPAGKRKEMSACVTGIAWEK